jgi:tetratricopeptide (TPR) repeat protein
MEKADELRPNDPETQNNLGALYYLKGNYRRAEHVLRAALEKRPAMPKAWDNLGLVLYRTQRYPEAREAFAKEIALAPKSADGHYNLGCAAAAENKTEEAIAAFRKALEVQPVHVEAMHNLAVLQNERKDRNPAVQRELLERAVKTNPNYAQAWLALGRFYQTEPQFRDLDKAYEHYERYCQIERDDTDSVEQVSRTMSAIRAAKGK